MNWLNERQRADDNAAKLREWAREAHGDMYAWADWEHKTDYRFKLDLAKWQRRAEGGE